MIEQGLVELVQGTAAVSAIALDGGFQSSAPKGTALPTWTYTIVSDVADYTLDGSQGLTMRRVQIDCYGASSAARILLAQAIDTVLSGYAGVLTDPDSTRVYGCFRSSMIDFFDPDSRTFRRMIEYEIWFNDTVVSSPE
jgi:hypothetical protein